MSERSTGLFLPGHVPAHALAALLAQAPGVQPADLSGEEAPRVGHGAREGRPYTHLALRLFEVGGLALMEQERPPGPEELEMWLGERLSRAYGLALYAHYDDERGAGGHALFRDGRLVSRAVIDGRLDRPVRRGLGAEEPLANVDPSDWVWPHIAEAVEAGTSALFGPGVRTDDDLAAIIQAAAAAPVSVTPPRPAAPPPAEAADPVNSGGRRRDKLKGALKGLLGWD
ncbi:hypothetical protein L6R49_02515 [Myxococcota bacterium]|nr:hypothetical protein [Myxococcota bacterium]